MARSRRLMILALLLLAAASPARNHYYWFPAAPDGTPRAWAVLLPRAEGLGKLAPGNQYWDLAHWLNARGIDALVVDYANAGPQVPDAKGKTGQKIAAIIRDALADAREQQRMDARCPGVAIGWSRGAEGALTLATAEDGSSQGFKGAVVYYPSVRSQERPWRQRLPVIALQGDADGIAPASSLQSLVSGRLPTQAEFEVRLYPGARHRFDVAHPVDNPTGKAPGEFDANASADALAAIASFLDRHAISTAQCARG